MSKNNKENTWWDDELDFLNEMRTYNRPPKKNNNKIKFLTPSEAVDLSYLDITVDLMEIADHHVTGAFELNKKTYGFCFRPADKQVWTFSPRLRTNQKEVKEALTRRILRDTVCS